MAKTKRKKGGSIEKRLINLADIVIAHYRNSADHEKREDKGQRAPGWREGIFFVLRNQPVN